jgi:hypothetical protein
LSPFIDGFQALVVVMVVVEATVEVNDGSKSWQQV